MKRILSDLQVVEAYKMYVDKKLSTYQLSKIYNCSAVSIQKEFKKFGFAVRDPSHAKQKYFINESIFDKIDTEEKAYWLGFLYADGNVSVTNRVRLSLAEEDKEIVEKFSNFIFDYDRVKKYNLPPAKNGQNLLYVDVCNKHITQKLTEWGCPPKKTFILTFPDWLEKKLQPHFIRGYFDGDGCLGNYKSKQKGRSKLNNHLIINEYDKSFLAILSTKELLNSLSEIFLNLNINSSINKRHKNRINNNYTLTVSGNLQIEKLMNWMYNGATIFLQRKYDKFLQLKQINENKKISTKKT